MNGYWQLTITIEEWMGTSIDSWLVDVVIDVTDGGVGLAGQLLEKLWAELFIDEVGCVGRMLMLESVVAAAEGQLAVADESHFARTVRTAPVVAVLVAAVVVEIVVLVDDSQSVTFGTTKRHIDGRVCQHLVLSIESLPTTESIHIFMHSFFHHFFLLLP